MVYDSPSMRCLISCDLGYYADSMDPSDQKCVECHASCAGLECTNSSPCGEEAGSCRTSEFYNDKSLACEDCTKKKSGARRNDCF
jgi:hypothetical protein